RPWSRKRRRSRRLPRPCRAAAGWAEWTSKSDHPTQRQTTKGAVRAAPFGFDGAEHREKMHYRPTTPRALQAHSSPNEPDPRPVSRRADTIDPPPCNAVLTRNRNKSKLLVVRSWPPAPPWRRFMGRQ